MKGDDVWVPRYEFMKRKLALLKEVRVGPRNRLVEALYCDEFGSGSALDVGGTIDLAISAEAKHAEKAVAPVAQGAASEVRHSFGRGNTSHCEGERFSKCEWLKRGLNERMQASSQLILVVRER